MGSSRISIWFWLTVRRMSPGATRRSLVEDIHFQPFLIGAQQINLPPNGACHVKGVPFGLGVSGGVLSGRGQVLHLFPGQVGNPGGGAAAIVLRIWAMRCRSSLLTSTIHGNHYRYCHVRDRWPGHKPSSFTWAPLPNMRGCGRSMEPMHSICRAWTNLSRLDLCTWI